MEILNDPEIIENLPYIVFGLGAMLATLYVTYQDEKQFKKTKLLKGKIIGYSHAKLDKISHNLFNKPPLFYVIFQYKENNEPLNIAVKNLPYFKKEGEEIEFNIDKNGFFHHPKNKRAFKICLFFCILLIFIFLGPLLHPLFLEKTSYFWLASPFIILGYFIYMESIAQKQMKSWQPILFPYVRARRPLNYDQMTEENFEAIKNKDILSFEEAMAYYYHHSQKGKLLEFIAWAILCIGIFFVIDMMFNQSEILFYLKSAI